MSLPDLTQRLTLALQAAEEAGRITLEYFCQDNFQVERKADASPVTIADRRAEEHLRLRIAAAYPQDGILGEELPERPGTSGFRWILDPIDGTQSFIRGVPLYGTLIGLEYKTRSVLGVNRIPALGECVYAAVGQGAWYIRADFPPRPARVSATAVLADALFCTSDVAGFTRTGRDDAYRHLQNAVRVSRTWGDCYGYLLTATGRCDVMIDPQMNIWDAAALQPIMEEAGGAYTDWRGTPTIHGGEGIACNPLLLDQVLALTRAASLSPVDPESPAISPSATNTGSSHVAG